MKLIVELTNKNLIKKYLKLANVSHFIIGFENLSFNANKKFAFFFKNGLEKKVNCGIFP